MKAIWIASVPELTATQCLAPQNVASSASSSATSGPRMNWQCASTAIQPPAQFVRDARLLRLQVEERNGRTCGHGRFTTGISPSAVVFEFR